ncbi:MAG: hypothetical protein IRZ08_20730, partial [Frankia sp.]|nr:hypothetical protein [Frankia sp.]
GSGPRERSGWGGKVPDTGWGGQSGWGGQPGWTTRPARHPAPGLRVVPAAELALEPVAAVDGARSLARVTQAPPAAAGSTLTSDPATADAAWWRAVVGTSAVLVGLAARMVALTVDHVRGREQFGKPVGSFQAVKHALANAHVAVEFARPAVLAAGWRLAHDDAAPASVAGPESAQDTASVAKVLAADAARLAARTAIQCHGAIGYTTEYDLHLFAKRAWALIPAYGDPTWHRARLAGSLGLAEEPAEPAGSPDRPNAALA